MSWFSPLPRWVGPIAAGLLFVDATTGSWYVLDLHAPPSCHALNGYGATLNTPDDLVDQLHCTHSQTAFPNATRVFCGNWNLYFYLFPSSAACEEGRLLWERLGMRFDRQS